MNVIYGSSGGLSSARNQFWTEDSPGIANVAETADFFGLELAVGDFDADGFGDLAVGAPYENIGKLNAGAVYIILGSSAGLSAAGSQFFNPDTPGIEGEPADFGVFGYSLVTGDFNGDGFSDLVIGALRERAGLAHAAGTVHVLYGTATGLTATGSQLWHQDSPGIPDVAERWDEFGTGLAAADFNADGFADLAIGAPSEETFAVPEAGAVHVLFGSAVGLTAAGTQFWTLSSPGLEDTPEEGDFFGKAVSAGDYNADGFADLAIATAEDLGTVQTAGAVHILYGSPDGPTATGHQFWHQDQPGIADVAEDGEYFGSVLATGDFNGDGFADLGMSVYGEDVGSADRAGAVHILYGSPAGLSASGSQFWHQDSRGIQDIAESGDLFGLPVLAAADFNGDGFADLAVGVELEDIGAIVNAGAVNVIYGSPGGLTAKGNQFWHQDRPGIADSAETSDSFGAGLGSW